MKKENETYTEVIVGDKEGKYVVIANPYVFGFKAGIGIMIAYYTTEFIIGFAIGFFGTLFGVI